MYLNLQNNNLTELTESDLIALCDLNNIKPEELTDLNLNHNKLTDINFIQSNTSFINLKELYLWGNNNIKDISNIQYIVNLKILEISDLNLKEESLYIIKELKYLKLLGCDNVFKNYTKKQLKKVLPGVKIN